MRFKRPRGTSDIFGERMKLWKRVEMRSSGLLERYGYEEIRTPIFEMTDLFIRTVGEATDIVTKEMYTFKDKKGRSITLRPENTAPVMRAFLENGLHRRGGITRYYYIGPMFRYDRPQAGRYRQFHQIGAEAIGSQNPAVDCEIIDLSINLYLQLGFPSLDVRLNSVGCPVCRPDYKKILMESLKGLENELCGNCSGRGVLNPMRIFDCKECNDVKTKLPLITDHLCEECSNHFDGVQQGLGDLGIGFTLDPLLVRGLDYYTKTAYEIIHPELGAQNALCGGGRYDKLAEECGGGPIPAVGFSAGMERLLDTLPDTFAKELPGTCIDAYFVVLEELGNTTAQGIANKLRMEGLGALVDLSGRNMKKQLKAASESGSRYAIIIGPDEIERGEAAVKNLSTQKQHSVQFDNLASYLVGQKEADRE
jgi:histidyl-tRNA synthetase